MTTATPKFLSYRSYAGKEKAWWNEIAIAYSFLGYIGGIALFLVANSWLNALGTVLLTHSLIYSAYLSHEFMHGTIFKQRHRNVIFGQLMLWMNGGCYYGFQALTLQHIAHHVDRVDVFTFDIADAVQKLPVAVRRIIYGLEWCYIPVVAFWARWQGIIKCWRQPAETRRISLIFLLRLAVFLLLGIVSIKALLLYFLGYMGMITVLRFVDAFQHTYEAFPVGTKLPRRDHDHEQFHTYSNLVSRRYPWLNLLLLNFGYHNAHHAVMKCPWHSIAKLDQELCAQNTVNYLSIFRQLSSYHRFRVSRLTTGQGDVSGTVGDRNYDEFYGAVDVSFITLY